jgi:WD40 repeat protein
MATIQPDDSVRLWNVTDPGHPKAVGAPLFGHTSNVLAMAFSPDGNVLATASVDYSLRLWNVSHPSHPSALAILGKGSLPTYFSSLAFGAHGLLAGTALTYSTSNKSTSARTWLWETDPKRAATRICEVISANPVITRSQWQQYFPGQPYNPPCRGHR